MKRRSLFLAAAAGLLVLAVGAPKSQAGTLDTLLGTTVSNNGLNFFFDSWSDVTVPASAVTVNFNPPGTQAGFTLTGPFGAVAGATADGNLWFNVTGANITDAQLTATLAISPANTTGLASVIEAIYSGGGPPVTGQQLATLYTQTNPPGPEITNATFGPQTEITVDKNIEAHGGSTGASISSVSQLFSTSIPEPTSLALLGIGLSGLFTLRRFFKRTSVA